jgi:plasmid stabilization system protein ParE
MTYTVVWTPTAERDLAEMWLNAVDRNAVASAANTIDVVLRDDPLSQGESRIESTRIMFVRPLGIDFDVVRDDRTVYVLAVWFIGN